jgi:uncharacterized protein (TIGR02996 family)
MSNTLNIRDLEEARAYAARAVCGGCQKAGVLSAYEVRKEGPNQGRLFVKCRHCGHFDWLSAPATADEELERAQAGARPCPKCGKGRRAQRVKKEGPNQGRLLLDALGPPAAQAPKASPTEGQRTEEGLLAEIRDNPEDETARLIYADWLEEHDQPRRAELIRVQVERDRLDLHDPAWVPWQERSRALLAELEEGEVAALRPLVVSYRYARGLIDEVEVESARFAEHAEEILRLAQVAALRVRVEGWQDAKTLVRCKALLRVRRLALVGERLGGAGARILAESPHVGNLRALSLAGQALGQPGAQALANSRYLGNLEVLDLRRTTLSRSAVPLLVSTPNLPRLRRLVLAENLLGDTDARALAGSQQLKELRELDLSGNAITNEGAEALARSPLLARLHRLDISGCQVSERGVYLLRQSPHASRELVVVRRA